MVHYLQVRLFFLTILPRRLSSRHWVCYTPRTLVATHCDWSASGHYGTTAPCKTSLYGPGCSYYVSIFFLSLFIPFTKVYIETLLWCFLHLGSSHPQRFADWGFFHQTHSCFPFTGPVTTNPSQPPSTCQPLLFRDWLPSSACESAF